MAVIALRLLVFCVTAFTPLGIFHISPLNKVSLCSPGENKLLATLTTNQNLRFKTAFHSSPSPSSQTSSVKPETTREIYNIIYMGMGNTNSLSTKKSDRVNFFNTGCREGRFHP